MPEAEPQTDVQEQNGRREVPLPNAEFTPAKLVLGNFHASVERGPQGGYLLCIDHFSQGTRIIATFPADGIEAERVAGELKPNRAEVPDSAIRTDSGIVLPS